ncbi:MULTISPECIES: hypothetical protein [unclassified Streptomyces]|uniref:hypothetical protein n=1 Tax=unclassified Streptomyces TaxID=2593676 RepID=UPI000C8863AB|nr:hypothetical protein [Streptomyces sp. SMS_SU21]MCA2203997.1 hypothetical protein [Streptomyces sp. SMS_SU21]
MSPTIEVDEQTYRSIEFAARMGGTTAGEVVARLVRTASVPPSAPAAASNEGAEKERKVDVYADYEGHRTRGSYNRDTKRIDITSGPLAGQSFKTPTGAARAVVAHYKPDVNPNRNGWSFWLLDDGSGGALQSIRYSA